ncbi:MAG: NYN domain-containing protein [Candidatus Kerfeldbacteria bacterium]|nr:NYN domain-containing protein [Candidatus Kerfeldbacteria bacterium]
MLTKENNYAFIDSQNLNLSIRALGWKLHFARFRIYLKEKYSVQKAFLFIGYIPGHQQLYHYLQESGYICIFKPTLMYKDGKTKGNCDAELVLHAMIEYQNYHQAVIITGDGDFHCLVQYFIEQEKLKKLLIPNQRKYSGLLKKFDSKYISFVSDLAEKMSTKRKEPHADGTV